MNPQVKVTIQAIQDLLQEWGASQIVIDYEYWRVGFEVNGHRYQFDVPEIPYGNFQKSTKTKRARKPSAIAKTAEQENNGNWRTLFYLIRYKIKAIDRHITTIEKEFEPYESKQKSNIIEKIDENN